MDFTMTFYLMMGVVIGISIGVVLKGTLDRIRLNRALKKNPDLRYHYDVLEGRRPLPQNEETVERELKE